MQDKQGKGRLPAGSPGISRIRFVKTNGRAERLTAVRVRKMTAQPALAGGQNLAYRTWSAGGISGALYLQSAIAGVISGRGQFSVELPGISGVDVWVFRNRNS